MTIARQLPLLAVRPRVVHSRENVAATWIDRTTKWGNPFKIGYGVDRAKAIAKYREWLQGQPALLSALPELRGKNLRCWCAPKPCHGDVLLELANR